MAEIDKIEDTRIRNDVLRIRVPKKGLIGLGMTGECTPLIGAMMVSGPEVVSLLLNHGFDPFETDVAGNDPLMGASIFGRTENVTFWLKMFQDWNLERKNKVAGSPALSHAVYMGPRRMDIVLSLIHI